MTWRFLCPYPAIKALAMINRLAYCGRREGGNKRWIDWNWRRARRTVRSLHMTDVDHSQQALEARQPSRPADPASPSPAMGNYWTPPAREVVWTRNDAASSTTLTDRCRYDIHYFTITATIHQFSLPYELRQIKQLSWRRAIARRSTS